MCQVDHNKKQKRYMWCEPFRERLKELYVFSLRLTLTRQGWRQNKKKSSFGYFVDGWRSNNPLFIRWCLSFKPSYAKNFLTSPPCITLDFIIIVFVCFQLACFCNSFFFPVVCWLPLFITENHRGRAGLSYFSSLATPTLSPIWHCPMPVVGTASRHTHSLSSDLWHPGEWRQGQVPGWCWLWVYTQTLLLPFGEAL